MIKRYVLLFMAINVTSLYAILGGVGINFAINIELLFSCPRIFDVYSIVIVSGNTAKLMIPIASTVSINFGKNIGISFGRRKYPDSEIVIEIKIIIFLIFFFEIPVASCGKRYLNEIVETIIKMAKIWSANE